MAIYGSCGAHYEAVREIEDMQKAIIVSIAAGNRNQGTEPLNQYLSDGWKVLKVEPFVPSVGGNSGSFTLGASLVILEK